MMPIDPVCAVHVDEDEAVTANYKGKTYYFCCDECKEEFLEAPEEYIGELATESIDEF
jgi:YHS domain-containing protein